MDDAKLPYLMSELVHLYFMCQRMIFQQTATLLQFCAAILTF